MPHAGSQTTVSFLVLRRFQLITLLLRTPLPTKHEQMRRSYGPPGCFNKHPGTHTFDCVVLSKRSPWDRAVALLRHLWKLFFGRELPLPLLAHSFKVPVCYRGAHLRLGRAELIFSDSRRHFGAK